jgi:hypothetical protein
MDAIDVAATSVNSLEYLRGFEMACARNWSRLLAERRAAWAAVPDEPEDKVHSATYALQHYRPIYQDQRAHALLTQDEDRCDKLIAMLGDKNVFQTLTLTNIMSDSGPRLLSADWRASLAYLPASVRDAWLREAAQYGEGEASPDVQAYTDWTRSIVARFNGHGVKTLAGTGAPGHFLVPGISLHDELALQVAAGFTPLQALTAATLWPATFMGLRDRLGSIDAGKWADLVLLDADPIVDIHNSRSIAMVVKGGRLYERAALDTMLTAVKIRNAQ